MIPQKKLTLKVKTLSSNATLPTRANDDDAGFDLYLSREIAGTSRYDVPIYTIECHTDICIELPKGYWGLIKPRSGMSKEGVNASAGVVDNGYRGEIKIILQTINPKGFKKMRIGDKIAQLVLVPMSPPTTVEQVENLSETDRGDKGFGSSGK